MTSAAFSYYIIKRVRSAGTTAFDVRHVTRLKGYSFPRHEMQTLSRIWTIIKNVLTFVIVSYKAGTAQLFQVLTRKPHRPRLAYLYCHAIPLFVNNIRHNAPLCRRQSTFRNRLLNLRIQLLRSGLDLVNSIFPV